MFAAVIRYILLNKMGPFTVQSLSDYIVKGPILYWCLYLYGVYMHQYRISDGFNIFYLSYFSVLIKCVFL